MSEIINKMKSIRWQHLLFMVLIAALVAGADGCKTSGKLSKKEKKAQIEAAKRELKAIISGTSTKTLDEQDKYISEISAKNYNDTELNSLLVQATQTLKKAWAEKEKQRQKQIDESRAALLDLLQNKENKSADELEMELNAIKSKNKNLDVDELNDLYVRVEKKIASMRSGDTGNVSLKTRLETNFQAIADASKSGNLTQAAEVIKSTLPLFVSGDTPVLIIIYKDGTNPPDYDKPTTINRYLNFLKDQKASKNDVDSFILDNDGKIKELDLIKK